MKVVLFCGALLWLAYHWVNPYVVVLFSLFYLLSYLDGKEYNGDRRLDAVRRFSLWRRLSPVRYVFSDEKELRLVTPSVRRIYIMVPGDTIEACVWALGLHGGALDASFAEKLTFVVPPLLMRVPLLRDALLACGAVTYAAHAERPLETLLTEMINAGRSVCFCPSKFANVIVESDDVEKGVSTFDVPDEIYTFARQERLQLVPIVVHGERKRYFIFRWKRVQRFFYRTLHYAFPMCVIPRVWSQKKPPPLHVLFGPIVHCDEKYESNKALRDHFRDMIKQSTMTGDMRISLE